MTEEQRVYIYRAIIASYMQGLHDGAGDYDASFDDAQRVEVHLANAGLPRLELIKAESDTAYERARARRT